MKKVIKFLPVIAWMGIIFYFSSRQTTGIGGDSYWLRFFILKSFHLIEYAILFILWFIALKKYNFSFLFSYLYSFTDEFHQHFIPGRTGRIRDTFFDLAGIIIGLLIIKFFLKKPILKL